LRVDWSDARSRCLREARRLLGSADDAEEAVQEAFVRAWRMQGTCRNHEAPLPWLLQITRNEALRLIDRRKRRGEVLSPEAYEAEMEQSGAEILVERMTVRQAVADLSAQDRELLRLRYEQDLTQPRVAEVTGLPEGTVKVRLHRARNRLRTALGEA
jgi:RNA polymerase sigma-70 factor, ECF subfamily